MKELSHEQMQEIAEVTFRKTAEIGLRHAQLNRPFVEKSVKQIVDERLDTPALVVSAGPSLHRARPIETLKRVGHDGLTIVSCDGALGFLLRNGIVPEYVVSVDPHPDRIVRWFGDTKLARRTPDDYFRNQDLDPKVGENERKYNEELIELVNQHGHRMKAILSTSVAPDVAERCIEAGMDVYWWNPLYDDPDSPDSFTRKINAVNKLPCLVTGGNVGSSSWVFTVAILKRIRIGLIGMDFSYAPETPLHMTQYYNVIKELFPANPEEGYIQVHNPHLGKTWYTDPTYFWYRNSFLQLAQAAPERVETINCSEGGILFGGRVGWSTLEGFLRSSLQPAGALRG
jgi:hypothetical protein